MVFRVLGQLVKHGWWVWLLAWIGALAAAWHAVPPWDQVAQDREFAFLPEDVPSRVAEAEYVKAFPEDHLASNIVLVLTRHASDDGQLTRDLKFIEDVLEPALRKIADEEGGLADEPVASDEPLFGDDETPKSPTPPKKRSVMARIHTPNAPGSGALLVSPDKAALLVVVELTTEFLSNDNWPTITKITDLVTRLRSDGKLPAGLDIAMTGSAVIGRDHTLAQLQSARATELWTVILVVTLLILIDRAPLLALIPLATVYLSVQLALRILAILAAERGWMLFQGIEIFITILAYGAGVDYCLFLTARYKEELDRGASPGDAVAAAISGAGGALVASAATVIAGIGMMVFAQFGKFQEAGYAIPLALGIVLAATLTFSPSLLRLAGRWAFWPQRVRTAAPAPATSGFWLLQSGALEQIWVRIGELLRRRPGMAFLVTFLVMLPGAVLAGVFYDRLSYDLIGELPADAQSSVGTKILQEHFPAGVMGMTTVLVVNPDVDFSSAPGKALVKRLTDRLVAEKAELSLADVRSLAAPLGVSEACKSCFTGPHVSEAAREEAVARARRHYVSELGGRTSIATRLDLVLAKNPFAHESIVELDEIEKVIRDAVPAELRGETTMYSVGTTASVRDLARVMEGDRRRIEWLVLSSVLVILVLLLRGLIVPLYLLLSVLFSYLTTLGITFGFFWALDPAGFTGLDWKVAIFLFTILIAVGEDYNIFLMARIHEEERRHGPIRGITEALDRTGPIISSCGIIMAGTFASLAAGTLTEMKQLGFALAFGVLLDTFVVRPILVPSFLILLREGRIPLLRRFGVAPKT